MTRRAVVGTAGHIDHGKTRLVEALTGIDCDRWDEEKRRGITIDLGFAHLEADGLQLGFVDVPGHERFLHNALAGMGGIRIMLLVVAADEGVKPQTREHLAICDLLGIPAGLVALTKVDAVEADLAELARLEVEELLEGSRFAGAPVLPVSSVTGDGIEALREALVELAAAHAVPPDAERPLRLPIDRAFHLKGLGVVVTGTPAAGAVAVGDTVEILPPAAGRPATARVRSVQVHGAPRERAEMGERVALQLAGAELAETGRGSQVVAPGAFATTGRLLARVRLLADAPAPVEGFTPVRVHLYASECVGKLRPLGVERLAPGGEAACEIRLAAPVVAVVGDRLVLRRPSPETTLGGGVVLDPRPAARRRPDLARAAEALTPGPDGPPAADAALVEWARQAGAAGLDAADAAARLGWAVPAAAERLGALANDGALLALGEGPGRPGRWVAPAVYRRLSERAAAVLAAHFRRDRLARGIPKAEAIGKIFPPAAANVADIYLDWLARQGVLTVDGGLVNLPGRRAELTGEESALSRAVVERFAAAGLTPASPPEIARELGAKPQIFDGVVRYLVEAGKLVRLPGGLLLAASALDDLRRRLAETGWERFSVADFKDRFDLTRKWAIPLLEHLDSTGATRRLGDERMVVRQRPPGA